MQKQLIAGILFLGIWIPDFSHAAESYIGESLGLDFYSVIEDGDYALTSQMVDRALQETPTLWEFGEWCPNIDLIQGNKMDKNILEYGALSNALKANGIESISMDSYQALALCLRGRYDALVAEQSKKIKALTKISAIWLYMDGTTENSEYDIMADIDRINTVLFSEELKYSGTKNNSAASFADFLSGKDPAPLFPRSGTGNTGTGTDDGGGSGTGTDDGSGSSLSDIIGESCTVNNTSIPLEAIMDEDFLAELDDTLTSGGTSGGGYTRDTDPRDDEMAWSGSTGALTSASDFFHSEWSCGGIFCINIRFVGSTQNALWWGKTTSIESILDKHAAILEPIQELSYHQMTNDMGESSRKSAFSLAGLKVYYNTTPQKEKRLQKETTPQSEQEVMNNIERCANVSAWLRADPLLANTPTVLAYRQNSAATTENMNQWAISTSPEWRDEKALIGCVDTYMDEWRDAYYGSLLADVREIEAFTRSLTEVIEWTVTNLKNLNKLPTRPPQ